MLNPISLLSLELCLIRILRKKESCYVLTDIINIIFAHFHFTLQREIYTSDEYADFELHLRPTYDFCMELLKVGAMIEVLEPQSLRHQLHGCIKDMWKIYEND